MKCPCWKQQRRKETKYSALALNFGAVHHDRKTHTIKITFLMFTCKHYNNHTHTHSVWLQQLRWKLTEGKKMNQEPIFCQLPFKVAKYNPNFRLHPVTFKNRPRSRNFHKTIQTGPVLLQHFCTWSDYTWSEHYDDYLTKTCWRKCDLEIWPRWPNWFEWSSAGVTSMLSNIFCLSNAENMAQVILKGFELLNVK